MSTLTFVLRVRRTTEVLLRVVSLFHKRAIPIERLIGVRIADRDLFRIRITVEAVADQVERIEANLWKLVEVVGVRRARGRRPKGL